MPLWCLAIGMLVPAVAWAQPDPIEQWDVNQFGNYCRAYLDDPVSADGSICRGFMLGFIAGAEAAQQAMSPDQAKDAESMSFTDRALKTRLGPRLEPDGLEPPLFCIDSQAGLRPVVEQALSQLSIDPPDDQPSVSDALCTTLMQAFPCQPD